MINLWFVDIFLFCYQKYQSGTIEYSVVILWYDYFLKCDTTVIRLTCNFIVFHLDFKFHFDTTKVHQIMILEQ